MTDNGSNFVKAFNECQDDSDFDDSENVISLKSEPQSSSGEEDTYEVEMVDVDTILTNEQEQTSNNKYLPKHMRCASHTLNLFATSDIPKLIKNGRGLYKQQYRGAMANCSKLWSHVSRSTQASDAVENLTKVSLRTPEKTRWNSTYDA